MKTESAHLFDFGCNFACFFTAHLSTLPSVKLKLLYIIEHEPKFIKLSFRSFYKYHEAIVLTNAMTEKIINDAKSFQFNPNVQGMLYRYQG